MACGPPRDFSARSASSGVGRSTAYTIRINAISAADAGSGAICTSLKPFINRLQARVRPFNCNPSAISIARAASSSPAAPCAAASGPAAFTRVARCTTSNRSFKMIAGSAPASYCPRKSDRTVLPSPASAAFKSCQTCERSARPSMSRIASGPTASPPWCCSNA